MAQSFLIDPGTSAEQLAAKRRIAEQLLQSGMDASPVGHPLQAMARALQGGLGGYEFYRAGEEDKQGASEAQKLLAQAFGGGSSPAGPAGSAGGAAAAGAAAGPAPLSPAMGAAAAAGRQIPPNYGDIADKLIGSESDGNPNSRAATSSATGSGQFINSTWLDMVKRHRPDLAQGKSDQELLALRTNDPLSREMTAAYAQDNAGALEGGGQPVNPATLKLAHFLGPAGARTVLSADPNAPVAQLLPKAVASNPFMANMRAGDMLPWAEKQMQRQGGAPAAAPASAQPAAAGGIPKDSNARMQVALRLMGNPRTAKYGEAIMMHALTKENGPIERGTTAHAMTDANGNLVYGTIGKDGTWKPLAGAEGYKATPKTATSDTGTEIITRDVYGNEISRTPKDVAGKERAEEIGKASGQAQIDLPRVENNARTILGQIEGVRNDPYLPRMTGPLDSRLPNLSGDAARIQSRIEQINGQAFLQAFNALKGAGQITEVEGAKATAALSRLQSMGVNDADYAAALDDFKTQVESLTEVARAKARGGASGGAPTAAAAASAAGQSNALPAGTVKWERGADGQLRRVQQ